MSTESKQRSNTVSGAQVVDNDRALWAQFSEASSIESFCQSWLPIQCRLISGVLGGLVLLRSGEKSAYSPVAVWPDVRRQMDHLSGAAEKALNERRGILMTHEAVLADGTRQERRHVAFPIEVNKKLFGAVVLEVVPQSKANLEGLLRQLHWGTGWLVDYFGRSESQRTKVIKDRLVNVLELLAVSVEKKGFHAAATTFVTDLATRLECDRVSIGFVEKKQAVVKALSHSATFEKKANVIRHIEAAMDEAIDQQSSVLFPEDKQVIKQTRVSRFAETLSIEHESQCVCVVPFKIDGIWSGAIVLERSQDTPFSEKDVSLCEGVVALAGPMLHVSKLNDRNIFKKISESFTTFAGRFIGPGNIAWKLGGATLIALTTFFVFAQGEYRVTADTTLEGSVQRAVVSPFEGYMLEAASRAGDIVKKGDVMAQLDDRDLSLEQLKWSSEFNQYSNQYRQAKSDHDWAQVRVVGAQMAQAKAKLDLLTEQLVRTRIVAPFDGVIVSGDLTQQLGSPIERGQVLFEVAPLEGYRLILKVDDRDIRRIKTGQQGEIALSAMPNDTLAFSVEKIMPVSVAEDGRNYFRVEAALSEGSDQLRPGMEGVGKVYIEQRNLFWIWTHELATEVKLWVWSWWR